MKKLLLGLVMVLGVVSFSFAQDKGLLIDDFEGVIDGGANGTVDFGAGNGSTVSVSASTDIVSAGKQSLKITYDAVSGGYMWIARGFGLDAKNAGWLFKPESIDWKQYNAVAFNLYGNNSKGSIAFDLKDNGGEIWRFLITDDFTGWKQIICPFDQFFARADWQPDSADKNGQIDYPIKSYQFEPLPEGKGTIYIDDVELVKK